ncbi:MAG: DNA-3-methyladenine glycosylase 2 family protein [Nocardiopsaceae bacterium]|nr:DNA-3-methyladenine glycosylase 2 family protein [Nocardiopsaceae bacterium]
MCESRSWWLPFPVDVRLTLSVHGRGTGDPTFRVGADGAVWRTSLTPDGPATIRAGEATPAIRADSPEAASASEAAWPPETPGCLVTAHAWGPGAGWLLDALPAALGLYDDISGFDIAASLAVPGARSILRVVARRHPGLRVGRSDRLMEALVPAILEQRVLSLEASRAWRILLAKYGTPPPGPAPRGMRVFPDPKTWRTIPSWDWHRAGVEGARAQTIIRAASVASSLERLLANACPPAPAPAPHPAPVAPAPQPAQLRDRAADSAPDRVNERPSPEGGDGRYAEAARTLRTICGIGPWTAAETLQRAAGDPDAVSVGDYHIPKDVGWALAHREKTDDAQMLELLEPYRGHRYRVTRLVGLSGLHPPRRGPRLPVRDYRYF